MRKTTKVVSLLLTLAMMLTMALPMTVSAAFSDVPSDHHYYDAITNLSAEGILDGMGDGTFKPGDPVTRAQFTKIICYALSVGNLTYSEEERSIFTDLAPEHWAANNIVTAYKQGIINGMGDGTFAPEAGVQYEQAVKMVVCALGYSQARAEAAGGYPGGYMSLANQAKILKGITDAKMGEVMNRGAVAQLIDNMLDADQIQDGQPSGSLREEVSTSKKVEGQVVAGYGVALYSDAELQACRKNEILLSLGNTNIPYDISEINGFDIYEYLGRSVTIYYEEESGVTVDVVSSIALQPRKNETIKIDLDMIYDYDSSSIEYYTDADRTDTETVNYQTSPKVLWNGQPTDDTVETLLNSHGTKAGYITLVSSQTNQSADVAFLKTYDTMVVSSVDTKNYKVFAKNTSSLPAEYASGIVLDVTDRTKSVSITANGADYALSSIRENHILSISKSANDDVIEVLVSTKSVSGTIEYMTSTPYNQIKLNTGNAIYTTDNMWNEPDVAPMTTGMFVYLYIDAFGKVARYVPAAEATYNYGYIASLEEMGTSSNPEIWVMIYKPRASNSTLTGEILKFANKVKIDGTNYNVTDDVDDIKTLLETTAERSVNTGFHSDVAPTGTITYAQPIKYTLDNSNQIDGIITSAKVGDPATSLNIINKVDSDGIVCTVDGSTFGQYRVSSSTPILYVPQDRESGTYQSKTNTLFESGKKYYAQFVNTSSAGVVGCVYLYGVEEGSLGASITDENKPLIVKQKGTVDYKDTETTKMVLIDVTDGSEITCYEDVEDIDFLEVGDIIRVAIGADEYVEDVEILADLGTVASDKIAVEDPSDIVPPTFNYGTNQYWFRGENETEDDVTADFRVLLATVYAKGSGTLLATPGYTASELGSESVVVADTVPVYKIDIDAAENLRISTGSMGEVIAYYPNNSAASRILIYMVEGVANAVIIFE